MVEEIALSEDEKAITGISEKCEAKLEVEQATAKAERELEQEELAEFEAEAAEYEYPRAVKQNFLKSCLATSGSDFATCECSLAALESNYTVKEIQQAEANIASGRMREMIETAFTECG